MITAKLAVACTQRLERNKMILSKMEKLRNQLIYKQNWIKFKNYQRKPVLRTCSILLKKVHKTTSLASGNKFNVVETFEKKTPMILINHLFI